MEGRIACGSVVLVYPFHEIVARRATISWKGSGILPPCRRRNFLL